MFRLTQWWSLLCLVATLTFGCNDGRRVEGDSFDAGTPDAGDASATSAPSVDDAMAACVAYVACFRDSYLNLENCLDVELPRLTIDEIQCLARSTGGCASAVSCLPGRTFESTLPSGCTGDNGFPVCVGSKVARCYTSGTPYAIEEDCAAIDGPESTCEVDSAPGGYAFCGTNGVESDDGCRCTDGQPSCRGEGCEPGTLPIPEGETEICDGTTIDTRAGSTNCAEVVAGGRCAAFAGGAQLACALGTRCDPYGVEPQAADVTCTGTSTNGVIVDGTISLCFGGLETTFPCARLGLHHCERGFGCLP